jgi:hypothetical protein
VSNFPENAVPEPLPKLSVRLLSRRRQRAQGLQKVQHAVPALGLLITGTEALVHGERGLSLALAVFELFVSALLLRQTVKELSAARRPHHAAHGHGVDRFEIFASGVLLAEALEHWHVHHRLSLARVLLAVITFILGLLHGRLAAFNSTRRQVLHVEEAGLRIRGRFFSHFFAPWPDIASIEVADREARILTRNGKKRRIKLSDLPNAPEVRAALHTAQERLD